MQLRVTIRSGPGQAHYFSQMSSLVVSSFYLSHQIKPLNEIPRLIDSVRVSALRSVWSTGRPGKDAPLQLD